MRDGVSKDIKLAWAVPIDPVTVTASLIAYESTYEEIRTFRTCASSASPLRKLPPEILTSITDLVLSSARTKNINAYTPLFDCLTGTCIPEDHYTEEELGALRGKALMEFESMYEEVGDDPEDGYIFDAAFDDYFYDFMRDKPEEWNDVHQTRVSDLEDELLASYWHDLPRAQAARILIQF